MAVKTRSGKTVTADAPPCPVCGEPIALGQEHCTGSKVSFYRAAVYEIRREGQHYAKIVPEYHHGRKWGPCWKCAGDMGCSLCVPDDKQLYCKRCRVAVNLNTLLESGPPCGFGMDISGKAVSWSDRSKEFPKLQDYPSGWVAAWINRCNQLGVDYDGDGRKEFVAFRRQFEALVNSPKTRLPSRRKLERERNRQVAQLAEVR